MKQPFLAAFVFVLFINQSMAECSEGCDTCTGSICSRCEPSYFLSNGFCSKCPVECNGCSGHNDCTSCKPNKYGLNARCSFNCPSSCLNGECYDDTGNCVKCTSGLYGLQCSQNCSLCADKLCDLRACSRGCVEGYYKYTTDIETTCFNCPSYCRHCVNGKTCIDCYDGFYLYQSNDAVSCVPCSEGSMCSDYCVIQDCNQCQIKNNSLVCVDCDESNDTCNVGCQDGLTGEKCESATTEATAVTQSLDSENKGIIIGLVAGIGMVVVLAILPVFYYVLRRRYITNKQSRLDRSLHTNIPIHFNTETNVVAVNMGQDNVASHYESLSDYTEPDNVYSELKTT